MTVRRWALLLAMGFCWRPAAAACPPPAHPIAVGGVDGFAALDDGAHSAALRASGEVTLYIHGTAWGSASDATKAAVVRSFAGTEPFIAEVGANADGAGYWRLIGQSYRPYRMRISAAYVNGTDSLTAAEWRRYVDAGRKYGVCTIAPVFTPNVNEWRKGGFSSPIWNGVKAKALYGGGLTLDAPPHFFLAEPPGYRAFIRDEIRWGRKAGLPVALIISPNTSGPAFLADTQAMLAALKKAGTLPDIYVFENYLPLPYPPGFVNIVGAEGNRDTVLGVAHWFLQNIRLFVQSTSRH